MSYTYGKILAFSIAVGLTPVVLFTAIDCASYLGQMQKTKIAAEKAKLDQIEMETSAQRRKHQVEIDTMNFELDQKKRMK